MSDINFKTESILSFWQWTGLFIFCGLLILILLIAKAIAKRTRVECTGAAEGINISSKRVSQKLTLHVIEQGGKQAMVLESEQCLLQLKLHEDERINNV